MKNIRLYIRALLAKFCSLGEKFWNPFRPVWQKTLVFFRSLFFTFTKILTPLWLKIRPKLIPLRRILLTKWVHLKAFSTRFPRHFFKFFIPLFILVSFIAYDLVRWTPPIWGGITELKALDINGQKQWLLIRGENKKAPVLLFLHGGSGTGQIGIMRKYQKELEKKFIVVQWDQRGAGLSGAPFPNEDTLTIAQFIADGISVTEYLKKRFQQEKIYLVGHSSGTGLGWFMARDYPQYFHAYAALAQMAESYQENYQYTYTLAEARALDNKQAIKELEDLGPPPWDTFPKSVKKDRTIDNPAVASMLAVLKWIKAFKTDSYAVNINITMPLDLFFSKEYRLIDAWRWLNNKKKGLNMMYSHFNGNLDLLSGGTAFQIPFYMILGERDLQTPMEPAANLYETISAPGKKLIIYRNCAHYIMWERTYDYQAALIRLFGVY